MTCRVGVGTENFGAAVIVGAANRGTQLSEVDHDGGVGEVLDSNRLGGKSGVTTKKPASAAYRDDFEWPITVGECPAMLPAFTCRAAAKFHSCYTDP